MKYSTIILVALLAIFSSCSEEKEVLIDFSGLYEGELYCVGEHDDISGEEITITISKTEVDGTYSIDLGDEMIVEGNQIENVLVIETQIVNEDLGFDVLTFEGEISFMTEEVMFDCKFSVDDEGNQECSFPIAKK